MMRALALLFLAALPLTAAAAPARLSEAQVHAFVARQSRAWNAGELAAYFALFAPDAVFVDQGRAKDGRLVPYGASTLSQAEAQTRRARAKSKVVETTAIRAIRLAPDGRSAEVRAFADTLLTARGRTRRTCAERLQTVVSTQSGLRSKGQTDTYVACR